MIGVKVTVKSDVNKGIGQMLSRLNNQRPFWESTQLLVHRSVKANFTAGGRPDRWKVSKRAKFEGGETLVDSGEGRATIKHFAENTKAIVGSPLEYMRQHQEGDGQIKRAFLLLQAIDKKDIEKLAARYVRDGR